MKMEKNNLRKQIKERLKIQNQNEFECKTKSEKALKNIIKTDFFEKAKTILAFVSCGTEISTFELLNRIFNKGKILYIPRTENGEMEFYKLDFQDFKENFYNQIEVGEYGIYVPKKNLEKLDIKNLPENTLIIMPGLAFDKKGNRLGKGKGFYDRFLEKVFEKSSREKIIGLVGFCYDFQIVDSVFTEEKDIPVDFVISDEKIIQVEKRGN